MLSIIGSNVWCFSTSRVVYNKSVVSSIFLCGYIVYSIFVLIIFVDILRYLTIGIITLSLVRGMGNFYFIFCKFFRRRKRGTRHSRQFLYISMKNFQKWIVYLSSSHKNTQFKKKNHLKWSPGSQEKYCVVSGISIGGCPLEEASEHERIPSIIGSIVWYFPTSRVFL
jgi:hypothetical protein